MLKKQAAGQPKGWRLIHFAMFAWGTMFFAIGATACTVVNEDIAAIAKNNAVETPRVSKAYGYPADRPEPPATATVRVAYHGSAPYICSPSGFGQKSRCFARPSI
ncbi:hypothetical protein CO666_11660 [Rhizobium chutanense]|uniref:Lipoprotein n=1 Tax=Rhizobium chutanense TaxID=2035448 RepID=A0A2A6JCU8_9HYPH|nr:hypothetical protein [Rhizobium chutanense]PDT03811.1 hypothetical protein CO666_11660 [Rhizobium chutanense]